MVVEWIRESVWRERNDVRLVDDNPEIKTLLLSRYASLVTAKTSHCKVRGSIQGRAAPSLVNIIDQYWISPTVSMGFIQEVSITSPLFVLFVIVFQLKVGVSAHSHPFGEVELVIHADERAVLVVTAETNPICGRINKAGIASFV